MANISDSKETRNSSEVEMVPDVLQPESPSGIVKQSGPDEPDSNLSWLVNLSAASLFTPDNPNQPKTFNPLRYYENYDAVNAKPGLTYTELIEKALKEKGELTVSEIYKWIYTNYPYYKKNDGRWKNSIRHNLSINPQFRKGDKCNNGGHFWTLNREFGDEFKKWEVRKGAKHDKIRKRSEEDELDVATRSIMVEDDTSEVGHSSAAQPNLQRVANDILNGIGEKVEVEYINKPVDDDIWSSLDVIAKATDVLHKTNITNLGTHVEGCLTEDLGTHAAPMVIEEDIFQSTDPILDDPVLFSDCLELGFQPYELTDSPL